MSRDSIFAPNLLYYAAVNADSKKVTELLKDGERFNDVNSYQMNDIIRSANTKIDSLIKEQISKIINARIDELDIIENGPKSARGMGFKAKPLSQEAKDLYAELSEISNKGGLDSRDLDGMREFMNPELLAKYDIDIKAIEASPEAIKAQEFSIFLKEKLREEGLLDLAEKVTLFVAPSATPVAVTPPMLQHHTSGRDSSTDSPPSRIPVYKPRTSSPKSTGEESSRSTSTASSSSSVSIASDSPSSRIPIHRSRLSPTKSTGEESSRSTSTASASSGSTSISTDSPSSRIPVYKPRVSSPKSKGVATSRSSSTSSPPSSPILNEAAMKEVRLTAQQMRSAFQKPALPKPIVTTPAKPKMSR